MYAHTYIVQALIVVNKELSKIRKSNKWVSELTQVAVIRDERIGGGTSIIRDHHRVEASNLEFGTRLTSTYPPMTTK